MLFRSHVEKKTKAKSHIWDNEIYFLKYHNPINFGGKTFQHKTVLGVKHYEGEYSGNRDNQYYKLYVGQKFSRFFNIGKGGTMKRNSSAPPKQKILKPAPFTVLLLNPC